jgi:DEAD/DEAH box helicase domain-containing protein
MGYPVKTILNRWRSQPTISENVIEWRVLAEKPADFSSFPEDLSKSIVHSLKNQNIEALYSHQAAAYQHVMMGENIAIVSGTASGKTLCYNLPVIDSLIKHPGGKALYLYPTKALTQDQLNNLNSLINDISHTEPLNANIYDGDTPQHTRPTLRKNASIILSNPDMLHTGILPHHTGWKDFLCGLRFIVLDEMHIYRGVFGSHLANVIRRLKRICRFYGSQPQFILTSATIANPKELAENLIEKPVTVIDYDGSPHGERHFLVYNPPFIDQKLGIRQSSLLEGSFLAGELISEKIQTIIFSRTRRSVELSSDIFTRSLLFRAAQPGSRISKRVSAQRTPGN